MILATGDFHGGIDAHKLASDKLNPKFFTKEDYLIICGDAGIVWNPKQHSDLYWQQWLNDKPWTTLFVDGNHENFDALESYPWEEWNGGYIQKIQDSVFHLRRGDIFTIDGKKCLAMGGAMSTDKETRKEHISWWSQEIPSDEEWDRAAANLAQAGGKVDYIFTHAAPTWIANYLVGSTITDPVAEKLAELDYNIEFTHWYFGHYHRDLQIFGKYNALYNSVVSVS